MEYDLLLRDGADRELRAVGHARASVEQGEWSASAGCDVNGSVREFVLPQCVLQGEARGNGKQVALQWSLHGKPGALMPGDATIDFGPYRAQGELRGELGGSIAGPIDVRLETVRVRAGDAEGACAALSLSGTVRIAPEIGAELVLQGRNLSVKGKGFRVAGGKLSLPVRFPLETGEWGRLKVARIRAVGRELGSLDLRVRQNRDALDVQGAYLGELLPGLKASVTGRVEPFGSDLVRMRADVDSYELPGGFDLGRLAPQLQGVTGDGILMAWVGFGYGVCGTSAQGEIYLTGGNLHDTENDVHVSGMRLSLYMPDLLTLRSAPLQSVAFDRLDFRGMRFDNGEVLFQAEERGAVVVETVTFDWLGGNIQSMPFRVVPGRDEYDLTLYCSNLRITELLEQLGFADARGEGRVSGRIPVSIRNGVVQFKAAQLQSSPDVGGNLRVRQAENLLAGVPASSPQYVQLRIASEALKDFEYRWAKVTASSNGEMLKVQLQLDGKPAGNLPFQYSRDFGFAEVSAEAEGMNFQGIRLDVNFNLPFDRMLRLRRVFGNNN
ncbi:intermembrane phospholipid transport protein YdbH family protein [Pseudodesulfovibrio tunisiensis]|uniref:intermembrane phospholipid transport protein YdbH family protein n=1 Tax=Pseudodesulfovibrio tunisiensis TaxID=463192 RepID=UPI001FB24F8A|nr:YdbH domain-containing protein [Pseudodesulfovibrio tunisiensis]